jgi:hypothetical protein
MILSRINYQIFHQKETILMTIECLWTNIDTSGTNIFLNRAKETSLMSVIMDVQLNASLVTGKLQRQKWYSSAALRQNVIASDICLAKEA